MEEGIVVEWKYEKGDEIEEEATIVIVESEKASADVDAREEGVLLEKIASEGSTVEPGAPIGILGAADEDIAAYKSEISGELDSSSVDTQDATEKEYSDSNDPTPSETPSEDIRATPGAKQAAREQDVDLTMIGGTGPGGVITEADVDDANTGDDQNPVDEEDVRATPGAKQVAREQDVDLTVVEGTGPGGVITEDDVISAQPDDGGFSSTEQTLRERERRPLSGVQETISGRLSESYRNAVHVTLNRSFETETLDTYIAAADTLGIDVTYTDILTKAAADTLAEHPEFNAHYVEGEHVLYEDVNIGLAVDTEEGLLTPVLAEVPEKSLSEIQSERSALTDRVLTGEYTMSDLEGGTFTITNLGMFGIDDFDPIINPPEIAILGVGRRRDDGTMTLSLSFDHRIVNGADAARFLSTLVDHLTDETVIREYFEE